MKKYNVYKESYKQFKKLLKYNKKMSKEEWDKYAEENALYPSTTFCIREDEFDWEKLKKKFLWFS